MRRDKKHWAAYFAEATRYYASAGQACSTIMNNILFELTQTPPDDALKSTDSDIRYDATMRYVEKMVTQLKKARHAAIEARTLWEESDKPDDMEEE